MRTMLLALCCLACAGNTHRLKVAQEHRPPFADDLQQLKALASLILSVNAVPAFHSSRLVESVPRRAPAIGASHPAVFTRQMHRSEPVMRLSEDPLLLGRRDALRASLKAAAAAAGAAYAGAAQAASDPGRAFSSNVNVTSEVPIYLPKFTSEGKLDGTQLGYESLDTQFRVQDIKQDNMLVQLPQSWRQLQNGSWVDPVRGPAFRRIRFDKFPFDKKPRMQALNINKVKPVQDLKLDPALFERADMMKADTRIVGLQVYYDYLFILSPKVCDNYLATACLPSDIMQVSATIKDGNMYIFEADSDLYAWRTAREEMKKAATSFSVDIE